MEEPESGELAAASEIVLDRFVQGFAIGSDSLCLLASNKDRLIGVDPS